MRPKRPNKGWNAWVMGLALWVLSATVAGQALLPTARNLPQEAQAAQRKGQALVVMVSLDGCPYCKIVREHYLAPMYREQGTPVVQINMQSQTMLADWGGAVSHSDWINRQRIRIAPTLLFLGPDGKEVTPRLEGISSADFYGAYLDQRLAAARAAFKP
ncbi:MAG: hypothetical protein RLZZ126_945 [Pseudomonadota bacterium]|jgi:thioredoxin-related protein